MTDIVFAGSAPGDYDTLGSCTETTNATHVDTSVVPNGIIINDLGSFAKKQLAEPLSEGWLSFRMTRIGLGGFVQFADFFTLRGGSGIGWAKMMVGSMPNGSDLNGFYGSFQSNNAGSWTTLTGGSNVFNVPAGNLKYDVYFKLHATAGVFRVFRGNMLLFNFTGNTLFGGLTTLNEIQFGYAATGTTFAISEVLVCKKDTRDIRVARLPITADGAVKQWTGTYTDVNDGAVNDLTLMKGATAGLVHTFTSGSIPAALAAYEVKGLVVSTRCRRGDNGGPQNLNGVTRIGGVNYEQAVAPTPDSGFMNRQAIWDLNPATGTKFTQTDINGQQPGLKTLA